MFTSVRLTPTEWLEASRQEGTTLHVSVPLAPRLAEHVTLRIELAGTRVAATLGASVRSVHRVDDHHRIEAAVDSESAATVKMLSAAARQEGKQFVQRPVRFLCQLPVIVRWRGGNVYGTTISLSRGGCSLKLSGAAPPKGTRLRLRIGASSKAVEVLGDVAWSRSEPTCTAGVRFAQGEGPEIQALVAHLERTGAPRS